MAKITIDEKKCKGCGLCVLACPKKIMRISTHSNQNGYFVAECSDEKSCLGCALCATMCPDVVIEVEK